MKGIQNFLRYLPATLRLDQLWLPVALWALCAIMILFLRGNVEMAFNVSRSYLGGLLPLIGGIMAAYAVLDDPALELHFSSPRSGWVLLLERLSVVLVVLAVCALSFQGFLAVTGVDLSGLGNGFWRQLAWLVPSLVMIGLGSAAGFATAQSMGGALVAGVIWFFQVLLRDMLASSAVGRYVYLFMGASSPELPWLRSNQASLLAMGVLLLWASMRLLKKQERFF